jgi:hypothetical protein
VELTDEQLQMIKDLATSVAEEASEAAKDLEVSPKEYLESKPVTLNLVP